MGEPSIVIVSGDLNKEVAYIYDRNGEEGGSIETGNPSDGNITAGESVALGNNLPKTGAGVIGLALGIGAILSGGVLIMIMRRKYKS